MKPSSSPESPDLVVVAEGLTVQFGDFKAVNDVTFSVRRGEIFGFLGANGAGKTTTIRVLCGLLVPTAGRVTVTGVQLREGHNQQIKRNVGYMSQKFTLYDDLSVGENLDFTAALRKLDPRVYAERRGALFDFISFSKPLRTLVRDLPGGMKQQVSLAASLLHDPEIVFLDEPTAGVTSASRAKFWELIQELARRGKTIFVTSHYMDEVEQCERIALMRAGEVIALDSPSGLKESTFPEPLFELTPLHPTAAEELERLRATGAFESVAPHGLRFHAIAGDSRRWAQFRTQSARDYKIREIRPSLEDVFIRLVEGKNR